MYGSEAGLSLLHAFSAIEWTIYLSWWPVILEHLLVVLGPLTLFFDKAVILMESQKVLVMAPKALHGVAEPSGFHVF